MMRVTVLLMASHYLRPDRLSLPRLLASFDNRINTVTDALDQLRINVLFCECCTKLCLFIQQLLQFISDAFMICNLDAIGIHVAHCLCKLVQLLLMFLGVLLPNKSHPTLTLIRDWLETLECIQMLERRLLLPNSLAHAVKLGEAFLLFPNKFIEIMQRADTSFLHEELYGDPNDLEYQKQIIDVFVNSIYVFEDKLVMTYNYKDESETISLEDVQQVFGSDIAGSAPPSKRNPNLILVGNGFGFLYFFEKDDI